MSNMSMSFLIACHVFEKKKIKTITVKLLVELSKFGLVKFLFFQFVIHYLTSKIVILPILINELVKGS